MCVGKLIWFHTFSVKKSQNSLAFDFIIFSILNILVSFFLKLLKFSIGSIPIPPVFGLRANSWKFEWRLAERSEAERKWKMSGGNWWRSAAKQRENERQKNKLDEAKESGATNTSVSLQCKKIEKQVGSFFSAKRLKKKLGHFLVQKDWKTSWVIFECKKIEKKSGSFLSAKRLKNKLGHFLVQKHWKKIPLLISLKK
jgi:hypothetical protein